jgi:hypothetical protein
VRSARGVDGRERGCDLRADVRRRGGGHPTVVADQLSEATSRYVFGDEPPRGLLDDIEDRHEMRVLHRGGDARPCHGVGRELFENDAAAHGLVDCPPDDARSTPVDHVLHAVPSRDQDVLGRAVDRPLVHASRPPNVVSAPTRPARDAHLAGSSRECSPSCRPAHL